MKRVLAHLPSSLPSSYLLAYLLAYLLSLPFNAHLSLVSKTEQYGRIHHAMHFILRRCEQADRLLVVKRHQIIPFFRVLFNRYLFF